MYDDFDAPAPPAPPSGHASNESGKGSTKGSSKGKEPKGVAKMCAYNECQDQSHKGRRYCLYHDRPAAAIKSQALARCSDEQKAEVAESLQDVDTCNDAITEFMQNNLSDSVRYKLVDFSRWLEKYGKRSSIIGRDILYPFEKNDFIIRERKKFGRSETQAKEDWLKHESSSARKDEKGRDGQQRIWLLKNHRKKMLRRFTKTAVRKTL